MNDEDTDVDERVFDVTCVDDYWSGKSLLTS